MLEFRCATPLYAIALFVVLNCPHNEMKLKQNSSETVLKLFCLSFISLCGQFHIYLDVRPSEMSLHLLLLMSVCEVI